MVFVILFDLTQYLVPKWNTCDSNDLGCDMYQTTCVSRDTHHYTTTNPWIPDTGSCPSWSRGGVWPLGKVHWTWWLRNQNCTRPHSRWCHVDGTQTHSSCPLANHPFLPNGLESSSGKGAKLSTVLPTLFFCLRDWKYPGWKCHKHTTWPRPATPRIGESPAEPALR